MKTALAFLLCALVPSLITAQCGQRPVSARVVAGTDAVPHSWPWQISLETTKDRNRWFHTCGGSLISPEYIVTAAHCFPNNPDVTMFRVVVGQHDRLNGGDGQTPIAIHEVIKHESFSMRHLRNDIALIRLVKPVTLSERVGTVCLPSHGDRITPGTKCFITGWGRTVGGGQSARILQQAEMPIASHKDCSAANSRLVPVHEESMLCAGHATTGVHVSGCQGDSGGPFVCEESGRWVLRGAVSWGNPRCLAENFYTVFARMSSYVNWINSKMSTAGTLPPNPPSPPTAPPPPACKNDWGGATCDIYKAHCNFMTVKLGCKKTCNFCRNG